MASNAADASKVGGSKQFQPPRLHHIDTSPNGGVSGPFWDSVGRCFWLMNNRQVYTHTESYGGSSACATLASANPDSAYPSGWSSGQRTRSLSGSDATPESVAHESKRIRPEYYPDASDSKTASKSTEQQSKSLPKLSNFPPPPPNPPQRSQSVRFSPNLAPPNAESSTQRKSPNSQTNTFERPSFPQRSQSVRFADEEARALRSSGPSPSPHLHTTLPTRDSYPSSSRRSQFGSPSARYQPRRYEPPRFEQEPEHEDEDYSPSDSYDAHRRAKSSGGDSPSYRMSRQESHRQRTYNRSVEYDSDSLSEGTGKEKRLRRTPDEKKKHHKTLKKIGEVGRGEMGRASFLAALPFVCFLVKLAA